jgi:hypothetical protein
MTESYCKVRLGLLDLLFKERNAFSSGQLWTLEPGDLRFKYGESIAELKIPYHLGSEDEGCVEDAVMDLAGLLKKRYEEAQSEEPSTRLREKTYKTDILLPDSLEMRAAKYVLRTTPLLDGAILTSWLGPDGPGKKFIQWVTGIVEKALTDEAKAESGERTSYLSLLVIIKTIRSKKEKLKDFRIRGLSYEKLDLAISFTLYTAFRVALLALLERLKAEGAHYYSRKAEVLLKSALVPNAFLSIPSTLLSGSLNPYGISIETFQAISPHVPKIEEAATNVEELVKGSVGRIKNEKAVMETIGEQYRIIKLREHIINYLTDFDIPGQEAHKVLYDLCQEDRSLKVLLNDPKMIDRLHSTLEKLKQNFARDRKRGEAIESLQGLLMRFKKGKGWFRGEKDDTGMALPAVLSGFFAASFDEHVEKYAGHMRLYLTDRREEFDEKMLFEEYNRGTLYRFSLDKRPILTTLAREEEGQLFVDMKDFTKKTFKVKEIAMAEFMKENFYDPILDAASRYGTGYGLLADERGIRLNSLPGDAAIFSGGVSNLVALAHDIEKIIRQSREKLATRLPLVKDEVILDDVHRNFKVRKEELKKKKGALERALASGDKGAKRQLAELREEEQRLEQSFRNKLEAAISTEMEAGLFISYGVKAETMLIEGKEDFTGQIKVAIGEKINEAARGTYRNSVVRAKLEMLLEKEKVKRNNTTLQYPFDIYIDRTYSVRMTPELDEAIERLIALKEVANVKANAQVVAAGYYNDLKKLVEGASFSSLRLLVSVTDIYNKGRAITKEALEAYISETKGTRFFFKKFIRASQLHSSIQDSLFFPIDELELWFGVEVKEGVEMVEGFSKSGEVVFKGFESAKPTVVYEILDNEGPFFKALKTYHLRTWLEEAKSGQG